METVIWEGIDTRLGAPAKIVCEYERVAGSPMIFTCYVGEHQALEWEKAILDGVLVLEYPRLLAVYEGVVIDIPPGVKELIDGLKKLRNSWVQGSQGDIS
jgi:hypothetical protein